MEEEQGDAAFTSFPGEAFRFGVSRVDDVGHIWLENQISRRRWTCEVKDVAAFAPSDVVLPQTTVLHYVAASLKESAATPDSTDLSPNLVREEEDETLQLEVKIKLGVAHFAWTPKYVFPMSLVPQSAEEQRSEQIKLLTAQVQELQQEVKNLKEQMMAVLSAQAASQRASTPSSPSESSTASRSPSHSPEPVPPPTVDQVANDESAPTVSRQDQVWGDIIGHSCHQLEQTPEFRETRNSLGITTRKLRQHTCKVCSALRRGRKRPFQTSSYCAECTKQHDGAMVFLCDKVRGHDVAEYRNATCSQIWHVLWNNGEGIPQSGTSSIRMRKKLKTSCTSE